MRPGWVAGICAGVKETGGYHPATCEDVSAETRPLASEKTEPVIRNVRPYLSEFVSQSRNSTILQLLAKVKLEISIKSSPTMDPASAGGLGVGVASLAFDAFDRSVKGQYFARRTA